MRNREVEKCVELYIISEETFVALVCELATSEDEVTKETAELLGFEDDDESEEYSADQSDFYLTDLTMGVLIDCECPVELDDECDGDCKCGGGCAPVATANKSKNKSEEDSRW